MVVLASLLAFLLAIARSLALDAVAGSGVEGGTESVILLERLLELGEAKL